MSFLRRLDLIRYVPPESNAETSYQLFSLIREHLIMRRTAIFSFVVTAALLTAYAAWPASLVAEPISQSDIAPPTTTHDAANAGNNGCRGEVQASRFRGGVEDVEGSREEESGLAARLGLLSPNCSCRATWPACAELPWSARSWSRLTIRRLTFSWERSPSAERRVTEARLLYEKANSADVRFSRAAAKRKTFLQTQIYGGLGDDGRSPRGLGRRPEENSKNGSSRIRRARRLCSNSPNASSSRKTCRAPWRRMQARP